MHSPHQNSQIIGRILPKMYQNILFLRESWIKILRYLVTGGCGSIGSALVIRLLNQGHVVCSLDNSESLLFNQIQSFQNISKTYKPFLGDIETMKDYIEHFLQLK